MRPTRSVTPGGVLLNWLQGPYRQSVVFPKSVPQPYHPAHSCVPRVALAPHLEGALLRRVTHQWGCRVVHPADAEPCISHGGDAGGRDGDVKDGQRGTRQTAGPNQEQRRRRVSWCRLPIAVDIAAIRLCRMSIAAPVCVPAVPGPLTTSHCGGWRPGCAWIFVVFLSPHNCFPKLSKRLPLFFVFLLWSATDQHALPLRSPIASSIVALPDPTATSLA
jgi:hypothetical protein